MIKYANKRRFLAVFMAAFLSMSGLALAMTSQSAPSQDNYTISNKEEVISEDDDIPDSQDFFEMTGNNAFLGSSAPVTNPKSHLVGSSRVVVVTAYSSAPDQTDSTPFIMANGKHVYDGAVAANFLPFGTLVKFPDLYGDKIFTVEDRMHPRFSHRMDIWMPSREEALRFGLRRTTVEIIR